MFFLARTRLSKADGERVVFCVIYTNCMVFLMVDMKFDVTYIHTTCSWETKDSFLSYSVIPLLLTRMRPFQPEKYLDAFRSLMHEKFIHVAPTADFSPIVIVRIIVSDATIKSLDLPVKRKRQFWLPLHHHNLDFDKKYLGISLANNRLKPLEIPPNEWKELDHRSIKRAFGVEAIWLVNTNIIVNTLTQRKKVRLFSQRLREPRPWHLILGSVRFSTLWNTNPCCQPHQKLSEKMASHAYNLPNTHILMMKWKVDDVPSHRLIRIATVKDKWRAQNVVLACVDSGKIYVNSLDSFLP